MADTTPGHVDFCGEIYPLDHERPLVVGREGDVIVDDNPYLHRRFLEIREHDGLWWLRNVGGQIAATVTDPTWGVQAYLAPGGHIPIVFATTLVLFSAGSTTYELSIHLEAPVFDPPPAELVVSGETTQGGVSLTPDQRLLLLALAEPVLRRGDRAASTLPSSSQAAERLGWPLTKFNRKLDNVCQKLARTGVQGLHGGPDQLASNRRLRLVEYAIAVRLVAPGDLVLLDLLAAPGTGIPGS